MTNAEAFLKFRANLIEAILSNPDYKDAKAFGEFEAFIKSAKSYKITDNSFVQFGTNYTIEIDKGRGKNKINSGGLWGAIYEWLELKKYGINYQTDQEKKGIAFAISKTIAKKGSYKHRNKSKRTKIIESAIKKTLPSLLADLTKIQVEEKTKQIVSIWQLT
ncbi:MAG: hypothetical protein MK076_00740 [Flavobacteriales bacterium]|nr:hypothetical protein [Flavobacteriales bacterium]